MKKLLFLLSVISSLNFMGQEPMSNEAQTIADFYYTSNRIKLLKPAEASEIEELKFVGFERTDLKKWEKTKVSLVNYVVVDTSVPKKKKKIKKKKKKKKVWGFAKNLIKDIVKETITGETNKKKEKPSVDSNQISLRDSKEKANIRESNKKNWVKSNMKFDFSQNSSVFLGYKDKRVSAPAIYNTNDNISKYTSVTITDNVVEKYISSKTNTIYYVVKLLLNNEFTEYGFVSKETYEESSELKAEKFSKLIQKIKNQEFENFKKDLAPEIKAGMAKLFPDGKIYMYIVSYYKSSYFKDEAPILIYSKAVSNIHPDKIVNSDFSSMEGLKFNGFKFDRERDIYELLSNKVTNNGVAFTYNSNSNGATQYRFWEKGESRDPLLDDEKDAVFINRNNAKKFNVDYFIKKITENEKYINQPLVLKTEVSSQAPWNGRSGIFKFDLSFTKNYYKKTSITIRSEDNKIYFKLGDGSSGKMIKEIDHFERILDTRIDKENYNFTLTQKNLLGDESKKQPQVFIDKKAMIEYQSRIYAGKISGFADYRKKSMASQKEEMRLSRILYKKYGKKYVDAAVENNVIVGMHEDLLPRPLSLWEITRRSTFKNGYNLYCKSLLDSSVRLTIHVRNKKVSYVYY